MITLFILCVLYTFFGLKTYKKLYGDYNIFDEDIKVWTLALVLSSLYLFIMSLFFIITYLP